MRHSVILEGAPDLGQEVLLRHGADNNPCAGIDHCLRHAAHIEAVRQLGKLCRFYALGADHPRVFHRHLVSQQYRARAVWAGGRDKNLQVQWFFQIL